MTKEEILSKARKENKGADIVALEIQSKSRGLAGAAAMVVGAVLNLICENKFDHSFPEFWVMFFCYMMVLGTSNFILGVKKKDGQNHWHWLIYGAFMLVMTGLAVIRLFNTLKAGNV